MPSPTLSMTIAELNVKQFSCMGETTPKTILVSRTSGASQPASVGLIPGSLGYIILSKKGGYI